MDWAQILVIILSIFLALFLLLGIVLVVFLIRLTQQIRDVTSSASRTASMIESTVSGMNRLATPGFAMRMLAKSVKKIRSRKKKEA